MIKNTAGQKIGAQITTATDGSIFTGAVTVEVTIDAGTQATGTVGSGACTHEGNGYHTYAPSQAETNGMILAFTFHGTGAITATVQVFTVGYDYSLAPPSPAPTDGQIQIQFDANSNVLRFHVRSSLTGEKLTGLTSASSGLIISTIADNEATATIYAQASSNIETISTLGTYAAPTASKCRFKEVDATNHPGLYEFQFADARFAVASSKSLKIDVSGASAEADYTVELVGFDPFAAPVSLADFFLSNTGETYSSAVAGSVVKEIADNPATVADVNAILALLDDARGEPGQGAPPVNPDMATKIDYLYKFLRNKIEQTSTTLSIYNDAGSTVDHKSTVSDDSTVYTRGEIVTGP